MPNARRFAPLAALLLGCTALSGTAQAGWFDFSSKSEPKPVAEAPKDKAAPVPGATLEENIRQAQLLRASGDYQAAIKNLSQMMMVASDDPRVVGEYGKTLTAMGRATDAISFLTRAQQLQPNDWTIYSALGVAYDQTGNQKDAQPAYERALALKPDEPSVLSNYALSRLLAKDTVLAANLAGRAEIANAAAMDDKIARNITMVRSMLGERPGAGFAVNKPAPTPQVAAARPQTPAFVDLPAPPPMLSQAAPRQPVQRQAVNQPQPQNDMIQAQPQIAPAMAAPQGVVMQRVPVDPLAGPVNGPIALRPPRALVLKKPEAVAHAEPKAQPAHAAPAPVKAAAPARPMTDAEALQARAEALAKTLADKPAALAAAKTEANREPAAKAEANKQPAAKPAAVKAAESKPIQPNAAPKVLPPRTAPEVKTAAAPAAKTAKPAAKDAVPALRVSSTAY